MRENDPEDKGNFGAASFNQIKMRKHLSPVIVKRKHVMPASNGIYLLKTT